MMKNQAVRLSVWAAPLLLVCVTATGLLGAAPVWGDAVDCVVSSAQHVETELPLCDELYPEDYSGEADSPWRFGIGAGYGKRSNPMINSDNIPIYGILQLSYFGDRFFFDNGDIGWSLADTQNMSVNLIAGVGGERSFYSAFNKSSVGFSGEFPTDSSHGPPDFPQVPPANPQEPTTPGTAGEARPEAPDRDYVIEAGLELLFEWRQLEWQLQALGDIGDKHNGAEVWLSVGRPWHSGRWSIAPVVGVNWLSGDAANYYYGVEDDEALPLMPAYKAGAAYNPFVRVAVRYRMSDHWSVIVSGQYEFLADEISNSSSVADDHVSTFFSGLYYEF